MTPKYLWYTYASMRRRNTFLFVIYLIIVLSLLAVINYFKNSAYLTIFGSSTGLIISASLIAIIIISFIYQEYLSNKTEREFITIVTHKFRTPLTGIRWSINMLQKDLTLLEKKDLLLEMQKTNDLLMEIVDLLVNFVKYDKKLEYAYAAVSLREIVATSLDKYSVGAKNKNISFLINSGKELPLVIIDRAKIQFVVDMLIDNAIKYTPKDGSVNISFEMDDKSISLKVTDSGIGIGFFDMKKIFRNFFRAKNAQLMDANGLGLGLYTARKIMDHHKGKIWAESPGLNKGSTFFIQLPIKR